VINDFPPFIYDPILAKSGLIHMDVSELGGRRYYVNFR
jgi:hypothetical protein